MQYYRVAFFIVGGISFAVLGWAMFREPIAAQIAALRKARETRRNEAAAGPTAAGPTGAGPTGESQAKGKNMITVASMTMKMSPAMISEGSIAERAVWFRDVAIASGVDFQHFSGSQPDHPFPSFTGSGVAAIDFDRDGRVDLLFGTGTTFPIDPQRPLPVNRLYRNSQKWQFIDVTRSVRIDQRGYTTGIAVGDYDNDGFPDLYIAGLGSDGLFRNQGDGTFQSSRIESGIGDESWGTSVAFADIDGDGLLDLYVCNYAHWSWDKHQSLRSESASESSLDADSISSSFSPETDRLYRNLGDGRFEDISLSSGLSAHRGYSLGVVATDLNDDGRIDFAVSQHGAPISLRLNRGDATFDVVSWEPFVSGERGGGSDIEVSASGSPPAELAISSGNSAHGLDASEFGLIASPGLRSTALLLRKSPETILERHPAARMIESNSTTLVGWGCAAVDLDLDGRSDVIVTNAGLIPGRLLGSGAEPTPQLPLVFKNADGEFLSLGIRGGPFFAGARVGRGLAAADLDNDGDTDIVINHLDGLPAVLRNNAIGVKGDGAISIGLELVGSRGTRDAIGARFEAKLSRRTIRAEIRGGGSYLSAHDRRINVGIEPDESPLNGEIIWADGNRFRVENLRAGESYKVIEPLDPQRPAVIHSQTRRS